MTPLDILPGNCDSYTSVTVTVFASWGSSLASFSSKLWPPWGYRSCRIRIQWRISICKFVDYGILEIWKLATEMLDFSRLFVGEIGKTRRFIVKQTRGIQFCHSQSDPTTLNFRMWDRGNMEIAGNRGKSFRLPILRKDTDLKSRQRSKFQVPVLVQSDWVSE